MKIELLIFGVTAFLIFNAYYEGKYMKLASTYKKYIQMAFFAFLGIVFYLLIKKNPAQCKNMLYHANNMVKYMPVNKSSMDMLSPILDFTSSDDSHFMENMNSSNGNDYGKPSYERRILQSGGKSSKRSVSETKKKYVASMQNWKCGDCDKQLNAWFEVDHKKRLEYGGTNEVENLVALCRDCHGKKTAFENM
jgi:hypothetical protein